MMKINIATLFPEMCEVFLSESIIGRARRAEKIDINCHQIRDYTTDKQRRVDDYPYGGGKGMVMQADPIFRCFEAVTEKYIQKGEKPYVIYMSPKGNTLTQEKAIELKERGNLFIICGHYEGIDQRLIDEIVDEEISIGDYVLTGGEMPALVLTDVVSRLCPGVLSEDVCFEEESHYNGLLEHPQYTRPFQWHGRQVPDVLISGHHKNIENWKKDMAIEETMNKRPDILENNK